MKIWCIVILWCLIGRQHGGNCQELGKSQANSYFYMKQNGGYEYAFNTDTGLQSAQTADQSNEVTGHYMYYEKGVPYMVKYRAGIHGFQPEIIPAANLLNGNFEQPTKLQSFNAAENSLNARNTRTSAFNTADNSLNARDIRTSSLPLQDNNPNNYRLTQNQQQSSKVSAFSIGQDTTLNFVQNALKTMQTQPMHLSFTSELGQIQHPAGPFTTTPRPLRTAPTLLQPVTRNDVQEINNLSALPAANAESKHPYSFNYNADQSARSETSDPSGNVIGSYSYYDDAGYHDISYKASDDTGFVVLGGNLAHNQPPPIQLQSEFAQHQPPNQLTHQHLPQRRQLFRNNNFNFNNYRILPDSRLASNVLDDRNLGKRSLRSTNIVHDRNLGKRSLPTTTNTLDDRNVGKRSLRKFRRYAKW